MKNVTGWSPYSDVAYIFAFSIPDRPVRPTFISATDTTATIGFKETINDNGIAIKGYDLYIDAGGDLSSSFTKVASYPATGFAA